MISNQEIPKVYTTSAQLTIEVKQQGNQQMKQLTHIAISISAYPNCVFIIVNETGTIGTIMRGTAEMQSEQADLYDEYDQYQEQQQKQFSNQKQYIYQCKTLLGSTEIYFYDLIMRKLVQIIFEENKMPIEAKGEKSKVILNIGLAKANSDAFNKNQKYYFESITQKLRELLIQVI